MITLSNICSLYNVIDGLLFIRYFSAEVKVCPTSKSVIWNQDQNEKLSLRSQHGASDHCPNGIEDDD